MSRFIPINAEAREFPAAAVIAYCYQSDRGPAFVAYKGRQGKPARFFAFGSVERRDDNLAGYVKQEAEREQYKRARREAGHGLEVGDIVYLVVPAKFRLAHNSYELPRLIGLHLPYAFLPNWIVAFG